MRRVLPLAALLALLIAAPASAEDFEVNIDHDDANNACDGSQCTLREATVAAGPGDRVIVPGGTYQLQQGQLVLDGEAVVGAGARTTIIEGTGEDRVFFADRSNSSISGVTITGGSADLGGGALVQFNVEFPTASLTLTDVTVFDNFGQRGGGLANFGRTLTVIRSTVSGNGAGMPTSGGHGGGIATFSGTTTLRNSTVSGNVAQNGESDALGGGLSIVGGTLVAESTTIAGNQSGLGSAIWNDPQAPASVTLSHTIVSSGGHPFACMATLLGGTNVVDSASCGSPVADALLGPLQDNGGPTDTHAITAGSPAVNAGVSCEPTDQRGVARVGACDIGAFESDVAQPPPQPPPPSPPEGDDELPAPTSGKTVNVLPKSGTVRIKLPGRKRFRTLAEGEQLPVGTIVDTRNGRVTLVAAGGQTADFYGGTFKIGQGKGAKPLTTLLLVEKLSCAKRGKASAAAKAKKKRRLWGDGKGRFRTKGKYSSATVRGTKWLVEDRCSNTLTRVAKGRVAVRDFVRRKTILVRAGKKYVARRKS